MQAREGGLLQMEGRAAREALGGEVEEGKAPQAGGRGGLAGVSGDGGGGKEIVAVEIEGNVSVGTGRHLEVEGDVAAVHAEVEDLGRLVVCVVRLAESDGIGELTAAGSGGVEAEIGEVGSCVREDLGVNEGAGLGCSAAGGQGHHALVAKIGGAGFLPLGRGCLPEEEEGEEV